MLSNFALVCAIKMVPENLDGLKFNGTNQLLAYADNVNILGRSVHSMKKSTEAFVTASKETGLEVNADKTKYIITSRDQNAGRSHIIKTDNRSFESVEQFWKQP